MHKTSDPRRKMEQYTASLSKNQMKKDWGSKRTTMYRRLERNETKQRFVFGY